MDHLRPINYRVHIEPDLTHFSFSGSTELMLHARKPVKKITLNALSLAVWSSEVEVGGELKECPFQVDPQKEELTIFLPQVMAGEIKMAITYAGEINNRLAGFYRSTYRSGGGEKFLAVTQFEESDARRAFPCLDHPKHKATFDVELVLDDHLKAIGNGPIVEEKPLGGGKKLIRFQRTPIMSSYLVFWGVGEFEFAQEPGPVLIRVATMPTMSRHAPYGLKFARKSLRFCENYYGIPFPLPKLDLIAVPDFAAGAMENWGAITFRENLLLHYPGITSREGEERICEVIAHEIIHQWFGNLVTPSDWKYLWLNESFATFFSYHVVDHYHPEWEAWDQFLHSQTDPALRRDALVETFPIEIPGGVHVVINVSTAPIIYNKGGGVLRQIQGYVGDDAFQEGLRHYLKKHQYGCASSRDLWKALEEVSESPVTKLMKTWVEQPGFPIIEVAKEGNDLRFTQKRFSYLPNDSEQAWLIPLQVTVFYADSPPKEIAFLLTNKTDSVGIGAHAVTYKVNWGQKGFYRVAYQETSALQELGKRVERKELPSPDRWGLQNDLYALVGSGDFSMDDYLEFLRHYRNEDSYLPLASIALNLFQAHLVLEGPKKEKVVALARSLLEGVLTKIGYEPNPRESHLVSILRDQLLFHAALYGSREVSAFGRDAFASLARGNPVPQDIMKSVMQTGALYGTDDAFQWLEKRLRTSESEHERMNILAALGSFREPALIKKAQLYILEKVPDRNKFIPISHLATNPYAAPTMWEWFESNIATLERFHPVHFERVVAAVVPICGLGKEERVKAFFRDYLEKNGKGRDAIKLSLERLEVHARMRASSGG